MEVPSQQPTETRRDEKALAKSASSPAKWKVRKPPPPGRRLRVYALDPSVGKSLALVAVNETTLSVPWDDMPSAPLQRGPVGEYLEVIDIDPASNKIYDPVDLNDPQLLAQDGWPPSEGNPQFHQQMVYAVAMTTIEHFEKALGRKALWAPRFANISNGNDEDKRGTYEVQRLRLCDRPAWPEIEVRVAKELAPGPCGRLLRQIVDRTRNVDHVIDILIETGMASLDSHHRFVILHECGAGKVRGADDIYREPVGHPEAKNFGMEETGIYPQPYVDVLCRTAVDLDEILLQRSQLFQLFFAGDLG
jgi:hypothetical protein